MKHNDDGGRPGKNSAAPGPEIHYESQSGVEFTKGRGLREHPRLGKHRQAPREKALCSCHSGTAGTSLHLALASPGHVRWRCGIIDPYGRFVGPGSKHSCKAPQSPAGGAATTPHTALKKLTHRPQAPSAHSPRIPANPSPELEPDPLCSALRTSRVIAECRTQGLSLCLMCQKGQQGVYHTQPQATSRPPESTRSTSHHIPTTAEARRHRLCKALGLLRT